MVGEGRQGRREQRHLRWPQGWVQAIPSCPSPLLQAPNLGESFCPLGDGAVSSRTLWVPSTEPVLQDAVVLIPISCRASTLAPTWPGPSLRNCSGATEPRVVSKTHLEASFPLLGSWSTYARQSPVTPAYSVAVSILPSQEVTQPPTTPR